MLHLLDSDIGYSSDKVGDENCAYFLDGVDNTSTGQEEVESCLGPGKLNTKHSKNKKKVEDAQKRDEKCMRNRCLCISQRELHMRRIQELGYLTPTSDEDGEVEVIEEAELERPIVNNSD